MLRDVSLHLASEGYDVTVVGRDERKLQFLQQEAAALPGNIRPRRLDYRVTPMLKSKIMDDLRIAGAIELAVTWIHSDAPEAPEAIADVVAMGKRPCKLYDVLGSAFYNPTAETSNRDEIIRNHQSIAYNPIYLGFILEADSSRWLTNEEISSGVIEAIRSGAVDTTVGVTSPWDKHP